LTAAAGRTPSPSRWAASPLAEGLGAGPLLSGSFGGCAINPAVAASIRGALGAVCDGARPVAGDLRSFAHVRVRSARPFTTGFCLQGWRWYGGGRAGGGGLRLVGDYVGGGRPRQVADAENVERDADAQPVDVDGRRDAADGRQAHARGDHFADDGDEGGRQQRDGPRAGERV